jgi:hypothetical protein
MFFLYGILFLAFWRQFKQYELIRRDAVAVGERHAGFLVPSLSQTFGPVETAVTIKGINFGNWPSGSNGTEIYGLGLVHRGF